MSQRYTRGLELEVDSIEFRHCGVFATREEGELAFSQALGSLPPNEVVIPPDARIGNDTAQFV